jgi:hypothetical protein
MYSNTFVYGRTIRKCVAVCAVAGIIISYINPSLADSVHLARGGPSTLFSSESHLRPVKDAKSSSDKRYEKCQIKCDAEKAECNRKYNANRSDAPRKSVRCEFASFDCMSKCNDWVGEDELLDELDKALDKAK